MQYINAMATAMYRNPESTFSILDYNLLFIGDIAYSGGILFVLSMPIRLTPIPTTSSARRP